jgi:hypothetical protein
MTLAPCRAALAALLLMTPRLAQAQTTWEDASAEPREPGAPAATADSTAPAAAPTAPAAAPASAPSDAGSNPTAPPPGGAAPAAASAPPPVVVVGAAPAPTTSPVTRRTHDRFYLRLSLGPGYMATRFTEGLLDAPRYQGGGGSFAVQLGGTPARGFVVGGGLLVQGMEDAELLPAGYDRERGEEPGTASTLLIGPFVDYFPDPKRGFHFGGALGLGAVAFDAPGAPSADEARTAGGGAIAAWVGYDAWVAREWCLGGQLRYLGVAGRNDVDDWRAAADAIALEFTALFH